jgi:hypothetical protein
MFHPTIYLALARYQLPGDPTHFADEYQQRLASAFPDAEIQVIVRDQSETILWIATNPQDDQQEDAIAKMVWEIGQSIWQNSMLFDPCTATDEED